MLICKAILKYGYSNFKLEILEYCDPQIVLVREQFYLDLLKPEYNILTKAGSSLGFKHSEESKQKMGEADHSGRFRKGHRHPEEIRKKISDALLGNKYSLGRKKPDGSGRPIVQIEVLDLSTGIKTVYPSILEAARALDIPASSITKWFSQNTKKPYKGRYKFTKI